MAFGYTVGITEDPKLAKNGRSAGAFGWGGALGTSTWTEPKEELAVVIMVQQPTAALPTRIAEAIRDAIIVGQGGVIEDAGSTEDTKGTKGGGGKTCKEGSVWEGKGGKWVCKDGKWSLEPADGGGGKGG